MTLTPKQTSKFWSLVNKDTDSGCWHWTGNIAGKFGQMQVKYSTHCVHRLSWELAHGPFNPRLFVLHTCKNLLCVNPEHLYISNVTANAGRKKAVNNFEARCKLYNEIWPFRITEIRDRRLAEFDPTGV